MTKIFKEHVFFINIWSVKYMLHDQNFWHIKWKHQPRSIYGSSLRKIPFFYGELLKKPHNFQEFQFFLEKFPSTPLKRSKKI